MFYLLYLLVNLEVRILHQYLYCPNKFHLMSNLAKLFTYTFLIPLFPVHNNNDLNYRESVEILSICFEIISKRGCFVDFVLIMVELFTVKCFVSPNLHNNGT